MTKSITEVDNFKEDNSEDETDLPKIYYHCLAAYDYMREHGNEYTEGFYFLGHMNHVYEKAGVPSSYHNRVSKTLFDLGSIDREFRGGGATPSRFRLIQRPTPIMWSRKNAGKSKKINTRVNMLDERITRNTNKIIELEAEIETLKTLLQRMK